MKKILSILLTLVVLVSCQSDDQYEDLNRDPKNPTEVSADFLFNSATKSLVDQMTSTNVNVNIFRLLGQYWTETTYTDEANYDFTGRNIPQNHWSEMYRDVLLDLKTAKELVTADASLSAAEKDSRIAQAEVLMIYAWQQLVDSFGDIPYSDALGDSTLPTYDDAATIYSDLINRLNTAIPNLGTGFGSADKLYAGSGAAWTKFGNSLKLKLGIRLADVNPTLAASTVSSAVSGGVFTSNADNATYAYEGSTPNTNPVWVSLVQSGRSDFVPANTIVDIMNTLADPRRAAYFEQNLGAGVYSGGIYGDNNSFPNYSHIGGEAAGTLMHSPTHPASLIDFSEVSFFLAEAAERSFVGTPADAEGHYNNGITASFDSWGMAADAAAYLATPAVAYTTATGTWRQKIGTQFWLAMYNRGFEGWTIWRKYDAPTFNIPVVSGNPVPTRYTYPVNEQNLNPTNWSAASSAIGGDTQTTKIFWDVN
jgi:hypothetical protein